MGGSDTGRETAQSEGMPAGPEGEACRGHGARIMEAIRKAGEKCGSISVASGQAAALAGQREFAGFIPAGSVIVDLGDPYLAFACAGRGGKGELGVLFAIFEHGGGDLLPPAVALPDSGAKNGEWDYFLSSLPEEDMHRVLELVARARCEREADTIAQAAVAGERGMRRGAKL